MKISVNIKQSIFEVLSELDVGLSLSKIVLEHPADKTHGDLSANIAMILFGKFKNNQGSDFSFSSPRELAQVIADKLNDKKIDGISSISVAGPGFINFTFSDAFLLSKMGLIIKKGGDTLDKSLNGKKVMIEFTDPNPFKELHIGHLYSNVVGEAIAKLHEALGADVKRACYQGDVGMHVSKSIWGMQSLIKKEFSGREIKAVLTELEVSPLNKRVAFLGRSYAVGSTAYKDDEKAKKEIQDINYLVFISAQENLNESTDFTPEVDYKKFIPDILLDSQTYQVVKKLYVSGRTWSLDYFNSMYSRIGMNFDEFFFESLVGEYGYKIVKEYLQQGIFEESDGAIIFPGEKYGLHDRVFINSLGLPTYEAKELGLVPEKYRRFKYDKSIVITGNEIDEYFKVLLKALEFTSPDLRKKTTHLSHGMVRLPEGKMSSRTGKILTTEWILDEAKSRIKQYMQETRPDFNNDQVENISEVVGKGAIKFAFLKQSIGKDISFSFEESLSFRGNSGPYMQYTYVRCLSVLQKAQNEVLETLFAKEKSANESSKISENGQNISVSGVNTEQFDIDPLSSITQQFDILLNNKEYLEYELNMNEKDILRNLNKYSDIVKSSATEYAPHHIANYLYELAQSFNTFYSNNKIISVGDDSSVGNSNEKTKLRLLIVLAVAYTIRHGLGLLGIETIEKM